MSANIFNSVELRKPKRSKFDLTHDVKMSGKFGKLYPCLVLECVPGDKFHLGCDVLVRMAPPLAPVMHRANVFVHYFFVPNRLSWPKQGTQKGWESFITGDPAAGAMPVFTYAGNTISADKKEALDYFGVQPPDPADATTRTINAIPFAAFARIWNEYYRDQNLSTFLDCDLSDGNNDAISAGIFRLRQRCYEHDYFTASLPTAQKGTSVQIPLGDVQLRSDWAAANKLPRFVDVANVPSPGTGVGTPVQTNSAGGGAPFTIEAYFGGPPAPGTAAFDPNGSLNVGPTTINDLRRAFKLQEWLERMMLGGSRYTESIWSMFGVKSPDARLQRPEYITGVKIPIIISEVLNQTGANVPGAMSGHGVGVANGRTGSYYCQEHGYIIGILSALPRTAYQNGIPKHFFKTDFLDYFFPQFAHLGEQPVQNREIFAYGPDPTGTFGYVPRYSEYKYMPSRVAGDFRTSLDFWHMGRKFATQPSLNVSFVECLESDFSRIFAVAGGDHLWMHLLHRITAIRPMPVFGTPSI